MIGIFVLLCNFIKKHYRSDMFNSKRVYLDHAAATPVDPIVFQAMRQYWDDSFANPGAIHKEGVAAHQALASFRKQIAATLSAHSDEIVFTGSATESANLALMGVVSAYQREFPGKRPRVIISAIEHAAVREPAFLLGQHNVDVVEVPIDETGILDLKALNDALTPETILVSVMSANNEIGTIQPIREVVKLCRGKRKEFFGAGKDAVGYPYVHTDACQATNYFDLSVTKLGVDLLTLNAAKIYGPKGVALLFVRRGVNISPVIVGGGQEFGLRAGTENIPLIAGFAAAMQLAATKRESEFGRLKILRDRLLAGIRLEYPDLLVNGSLEERLPNNLNISLRQVDHEYATILLDKEGISVSTKSACNELDAEVSHVLSALRHAQEDEVNSQNGLRMSLGRGTTGKDIDRTIAAFRRIRNHLTALL